MAKHFNRSRDVGKDFRKQHNRLLTQCNHPSWLINSNLIKRLD